MILIYYLFSASTTLIAFAVFYFGFDTTFHNEHDRRAWWKWRSIRDALKVHQIKASLTLALLMIFIAGTIGYFFSVELTNVFIIRHIVAKSFLTMVSVLVFVAILRVDTMEKRIRLKIERENFIKKMRG